MRTKNPWPILTAVESELQANILTTDWLVDEGDEGEGGEGGEGEEGEEGEEDGSEEKEVIVV